jgi:hypothetical protein
VVDAFVAELDLATLGFEGTTPSSTGRPAYDPAVLLKIYIYGYLNRVQSSPRRGEFGESSSPFRPSARWRPHVSELVSYELDDGIATLTLRNGKVSAISHDVIVALNLSLDQAESDAAVVILTGQQGILSGGYDLKVMTSSPQNALDMVAAGTTLGRRMLSHPYLRAGDELSRHFALPS